ncbi:hypothetical protein [Paraburkholderia sp.]|uniref:hypothetical protein n=1 Tax=Paraburkholderia sp. TaxID=1926495 RepID=UPI0025D5B0D1|nr:hypothetical protein [Paraburkholderia sp.]
MGRFLSRTANDARCVFRMIAGFPPEKEAMFPESDACRFAVMVPMPGMDIRRTARACSHSFVRNYVRNYVRSYAPGFRSPSPVCLSRQG